MVYANVKAISINFSYFHLVQLKSFNSTSSTFHQAKADDFNKVVSKRFVVVVVVVIVVVVVAIVFTLAGA